MRSRSGWRALLAGVALACGGAPEPARVTSGGLALEASLEPAAPRMGANRLRIELRDAAGRPAPGAALAVKVHMHAMGGMPAMGGPARVREEGGGRYAAEFELDMDTTWQVEIEARAQDGSRLRAEGSLRVGTPGLSLEGVGEAAGESPGEPSAEHPGEFAIPSLRLQEIGVRSVPAELRPLARRIRALGLVRYDESALVDVSPKVRGWVRRLEVGTLGARVERGQVLLSLYSPELYAAQEELLQALASQERARASGAPERADWRVAAARRHLALWDVSAGDLDALARERKPREELPIRAPATGYVIEKDVVAGGAVEPGQRLLRIAPLERIWIDAEVYEGDAPLLDETLRARVELPYLPGRTFDARIAAVYPSLDPATRTLRVRLELDNPELALRPGMWANVSLEAPETARLAVPEEAVLHAGARSFVFLDLGGGRFRPRQVELGMRSGDSIEVRAGLEPGERVVASGTFLIASESRLRAALEQW